MELIRDKDIIFEDSNLENLFKLENFPVFMGCMDNLNPQDDLYEDFILDISKTSGIVQVRNLIQLEVLYDAEHSSGTVGKIWHDHHKAFADFMSSSTNPKRVFEIGGLHGILSKYYNQNNEISSWTIIEPNPIPVDDCPANFIEGFFGNDFELDEEFDAYVHSHTLEHIYNVQDKLSEIYRVLRPNGDILISTPFLYPIHGHPDDFFRPTPSWYYKALKNCGFKEIRVVPLFWGPFSTGLTTSGVGPFQNVRKKIALFLDLLLVKYKQKKLTKSEIEQILMPTSTVLAVQATK